MPDFAPAYAETRGRLIDLFSRVPDGRLEATVPACPEWTLKDLLAHLIGVAEDMLAGNLEGVGSPEWTSAQIGRRSDKPASELIAEWKELGPELDRAVANVPSAIAGIFLADSVTHEHDARGAVGDRGARDSAAVAMTLETFVRVFARRVRDQELPALAVQWEDGRWTAGNGEPEGKVMAPAFELFRALAGRRTLDEIRAFEWSVDPEPYVSIFSVFPPPAVSLNE